MQIGRPQMNSLGLCALLLLGSNLQAQTLYVDDVVHVFLRAAPSSDAAIVQRGIRSGTRLTQLQEQPQNNYINVQLETGVAGWVHSQYLVNQPIARQQLQEVTERMISAEASVQELTVSYDKVLDDNETLDSVIATLTEQEHGLRIELEEIKFLSSQTIQINELNTQQSNQIVEFQLQLNALRAENQELTENVKMQWFIYGGGAVGSGILVGILLPLLRARRRRSEWF